MSSNKKSLTMQDIYQQQSEALYNLVMSSDQKWRKQWASEAFAQRNATTDTPYNNLNQSLLFDRAVKENNEDPRWLTFNQIQEKGLSLNKGSKGSKIYRVVRNYDRVLKDEAGNAILDSNGKEQMETVKYMFPLLKVYTVFNAKDVKGIEPFKLAEVSEKHKLLLQQEKYQNAEAMINNFCQKHGIALKEIASEQAFYQGNNGNDEKQVVVPLKSQFDNLDDYFSVVFHEIGHSTKTLGIRINTETDTQNGNTFGSKNYAKEELTAELTALFLCKQFGIDSTAIAEQEQNSFAYLKSWIQAGVLTKDDFNTAVIEANRATKAIYQEAPKITLSIDDLIKQENKITNEIHNKKIIDNNQTITKDNIKDYLTGYNANLIADTKDNNIKMLFSFARNGYFGAIHPNDYKHNQFVENERQVKTPEQMIESAVERLNNVVELLKKENIVLLPYSESEKIPKDDFAKQINKIFENKDTTALLLLNKIRQGKSFDDTNPIFSVDVEDRRASNPLYQRYVNLGYMEHLGNKPKSFNSHLYELTDKGLDIVNRQFEKALEIEKEKVGKTVTIKEYNELSKTLNYRHDNLTGGTETEFANQNYTENMTPLVEEAKTMLERPFNANSLPYQGSLERSIEKVEATMLKWDNAQLNRLETVNGDKITNIKLLWCEGKPTDEINFGTDTKKIDNWFMNRYVNTNDENNPLNADYQGYHKSGFEITYKKPNGEVATGEIRIDVSSKENDYNPLKVYFKDHLEKCLNTKFIEQKPKLSEEIIKEQAQKSKIEVKRHKGMSLH